MIMQHPFADLLDLAFEEHGDGTSLCTLAVHHGLFNPQNVVHGGVLYSLADTGMGGAIHPLLQENEYCATVEIKISYFKPVYAGVLECKTTVINKGKRIASLESEIWNEGKLVAKASGSFAIFAPSSRT